MTIVLRSTITLLGLLLCWQALVTSMQLPDYMLPAPLQVLQTLYAEHSVIAAESIPTVIETLLGLMIGILLGSIAGLAISLFKPLRYWCWPVLIVSQAIPTFAIAPLLVMWLGYGLVSKIATTVIIIFFPITSSLYDGLRNTHQGWIDLAKTMNATKWRLFWHIRLPAALPTLASGIRIATVAAPIGAITGEWVGASHGLGYIMLNANARMQIDMMFAALIVIIVFALCLYFCIDTALRRWVTW